MTASYLLTTQGGGLSVAKHIPEEVEVPVDPNAVRWQAGGGILPIYSGHTKLQWANLKAEMQDFACFRFVQLRYNWNQLEPTAGGWATGFNTWLKPDVDEIAALMGGTERKRVMILLHIRHSHDTAIADAHDMVPTDMIGNATYGGGQWYFTTATTNVPGKGGKLICWWNEGVRTRFAAFAAALGEYINEYTALDADGQSFHPFMGISISETATGNAASSQPANMSFPSLYEEKYMEGYYLGVKALKEATPNILVGAFCNYDRNYIEPLIAGGTFYSGSVTSEGFEALGIALGNPNTSPDENGLRGDVVSGQGNPGVYFYYDSLANKVPLTPSWQKPDYIGTKIGCTVDDSTGVITLKAGAHHPTKDELYKYSRDNLHANHIIFTRTDDVNYTYWNELKTYLTEQGLKDDPTLGLNTTPPSCFSSVTDEDAIVTVPKFFTGHGVKVEYDDQIDAGERTTILAEMAATPVLDLMEYTLYWGEHETNLNTYSWTILDAWVNGLAAIGKKMCITLAYKDFFKVNGANRLLPLDLRTTTGDYDTTGTDLDHMTYKYAVAYTSGGVVQGYTTRLMPIADGVNPVDNTVQDRLAAFIQTLVARYDNNPTVVLFTCVESALGTMALAYGTGTAGTPGGTNKFLTARGQEDGQDNVINVARAASVRTPVIQRLNFTYARILRRIPQLPALKIGLGSPDCNQQAALIGSGVGSRGILNYYPEYAGNITLMSEVQPDTYEYVGGADKTGTELPSYQSILDRAKDDLLVNILVWQRSTGYWLGGTVTVPNAADSGTHTNTAPSVLTFLQSLSGTAADLNTTRPANWL